MSSKLKIIARIYTILTLLWITGITFAEEFNIEQALQEYQVLHLKMPEANNDGRMQTLNKKGAMSPVFDSATIQFIDFAKGKKVLDVGGAYGNVMIAVLKKYPDTIYHLNDLDARHLFIAAHEAKAQGINDKALKKIKFFNYDITATLTVDEQYDAILVARVLHFFSPSQMDTALHNLFKLLKPGGRIYIVAITPYTKRYRKFITEYEERRAANDPYPGYVKSPHDWFDKDVTPPTQQAIILDEPFMFMDDIVLSTAVQKAGLNVLECKLEDLGYHSEYWSLDGRENVILIAKKPE